ncbi:hypothetical protein I6E74_09890 [Salinibacterium sp. SWN139]|uniref:hypothetical protein n=1 Tax=Salinibacterium sp. SWN139 TaxID=2792055 RepID=UPI0018CC83E7|nr:hypothetical protein [Salinibacterium sp. SWN139]MBH0054475.1 hypothetical protein [Salinibacterium sp. SWN139]
MSDKVHAARVAFGLFTIHMMTDEQIAAYEAARPKPWGYGKTEAQILAEVERRVAA